MSADLIVYAIVAAGLIFWLRSILGTRHGDEKSRPNPYMTPTETSIGEPLEGINLEDEGVSPEDKIIELSENPERGMSVDNKTAENGLLDIVAADKSFDVNFFLEGAQEAFAIVVEAFADGERETLRDLLADDVYRAFDNAITEREKQDQSMQTEIHTIKLAEIIEARVQKKTALITVRFTAAQTSVTRNADDEIIEGHPDKLTQMRDIWVFGREIRSRDPRWLVQETRGDFEGDNDIVPNSDE